MPCVDDPKTTQRRIVAALAHAGIERDVVVGVARDGITIWHLPTRSETTVTSAEAAFATLRALDDRFAVST